MVYQRIFQSMMVLLAVGLTLSACGSDKTPTPQSEYCDVKCACDSCTPTQKSMCTDDLLNLANVADQKNCGGKYDLYFKCLQDDTSCADGAYDDSACENEKTELNNCIKPPLPCLTVGNGVCNEPEPAGDGTCDPGTDVVDCMPPPTCPTANNGTCDEPEGTNTCPEGSDPIDCPCSKCSAFIMNQSGIMLCQASSMLFSNLYACACDNAKCLMDCQATGDFCGGGPFSTTCMNCVTTTCMADYGSCQQDN